MKKSKNKKDQHCTKCNALLRWYFLKNGVCNACRNPASVVTAVVPDSRIKLIILAALVTMVANAKPCQYLNQWCPGTEYQNAPSASDDQPNTSRSPKFEAPLPSGPVFPVYPDELKPGIPLPQANCVKYRDSNGRIHFRCY